MNPNQNRLHFARSKDVERQIRYESVVNDLIEFDYSSSANSIKNHDFRMPLRKLINSFDLENNSESNIIHISEILFAFLDEEFRDLESFTAYELPNVIYVKRRRLLKKRLLLIRSFRFF